VSRQDLAFFFGCQGESLAGIIALPAAPAEVGVLVIVGGPQYRVGSHRQFTLLARALAGAGFACMRFDHRGIGDSSGTARSFESIGDDIRAAVDAFFERVPGIASVALWGLCDAASAATLYAPSDARVAGLALLNPWVRTDASEAATYLRHYYWRRLLQAGFWRKLLRGEVSVGRAARSLGATLRKGCGSPRTLQEPGDRRPLPDRMTNGLQRFRGRVLIVLSGKDYTAAEFRDVTARSARWQEALRANPLEMVELADADHTFSKAAWRDMVAQATRRWLREWVPE
jgi:uncharacterized protein